MANGFLGIFSKRDKSKPVPKLVRRNPNVHDERGHLSPQSKTSTNPSDADTLEPANGSQLSVETDYVLADVEAPPARNLYNLNSPGSSASSTKLKIPFRRRKQSIATNGSNLFSASSSKLDLHESSPPPLPTKPSFVSSPSATSEADSSLHLRPPPSRAAIFNSYSDSRNLSSTQSLPHNQTRVSHSRTSSQDTTAMYENMSVPDMSSRSAPPTTSPRKPSNGGGIFSWARSRDHSKSRPTTPKSQRDPRPDLDEASFNLKSFRHVTSPSPSPIIPPTAVPDRPPSSAEFLPPARPRPRGESIASDSSQRISVAAFREAQARRSAAPSPSPSSRNDGSPFTGARLTAAVPLPQGGRKRSSTVGAPSGPTLLQSSSGSHDKPIPARSSTAPLFSNSSSSESSDSGESESEEEETLRPSRRRTLKGKSKEKAQSELGHRSKPLSSPFTSPSLDPPNPTARPRPSGDGRLQAGLHESGRTPSLYSRQRASVSTSALVPDANAKRASIVAASGLLFYIYNGFHIECS